MNELRESPNYAVTQSRDVESAVAEVQSAMVIAQKFPRDIQQSRHNILQACARPKLAETALYQYARGGATVKGPSIRLAEVLAQSWGNMSFGLRELVNTPRQGDKFGESLVQAFCWDMQSNTKREISFTVPHIRHTRQGTQILDDPRDIYEMIANQGARRMRACILAIVPGDIIEEAVEAIDKTLASTLELTPEKRKGCLDRFARFGVSRQALEHFIQRNFDAIQPTQYSNLVNIYNSIRDGQSKPGDWFEMGDAPGAGEQEDRSDSVKAAVKAKLDEHAAGGAEPVPVEDEPTTEGTPIEDSAGAEPEPDKKPPARQKRDKKKDDAAASEETMLQMVRDFNDKIDTATDVDELNAIEVEIGETDLPQREVVVLVNAIIAAKAKIK